MALAPRKWSDAGVPPADDLTSADFWVVVQDGVSKRASNSQFKSYVLGPGGVLLDSIANVPTGTVLYRKSGGNGPPESQPLTTLKSDLGLTGTNSGDQTLTFTGAATGSGSSTVPLTLSDGVVTLAKMAPIPSGTFIYRKSAASGAPETQTLATVKADLGLQGVNSGDQILGTLSDSVAATVSALRDDFNALLAKLRAPAAGAPLLTAGGTPVIAFSTASVTQTEGSSGATAFLYTVTRGSGDVTGTSSASWAVTGTGGIPANASDFQGGAFPSGTVTFGPGVTSQVITINVAGDAVVETDETFTVTLSAPSGATLGTATAAGTITNDDTVPVITMTTASVTQAEGNSGTTNFSYTVTRGGNLSGASSVDWAVTGSGANPAVAADFVGAALPSGSLSWATGETVKTITIPVAGDSTVETDEAFTVTLSNVSGATLDATTATGTITNDDSAVSTSRSAPVLGFPTPKTTNPATITISLGSDWQTGDILKLDRSASASMSSPTTLSRTLTDADAAAGTFSIGLSGVTLSGNTYFQAYETGSSNKSNVVAWGDSTGPVISTPSTNHVTETFPLSLDLTFTDVGGVGVPAALSDGTLPGWYVAGGLDQLQLQTAIVTGNPKFQWYGNGSQSYGSPTDNGKDNTYDVIVGAIDYAGNKTTKAIQILVDQADTTVDTFSLGGLVTGAVRSSAFTTSPMTVSGLTSGVSVPFTVTGGTVHGTINGVPVSGLTSGFVKNGDTLTGDGTNSALYETKTTLTLNINGVSSSYQSTTLADPANVPVVAGTSGSTTLAGGGGTATFNLSFPATGAVSDEAYLALSCYTATAPTSVKLAGTNMTLEHKSGSTFWVTYIYKLPLTGPGTKQVDIVLPAGAPVLASSFVIGTSNPTSTSTTQKAANFYSSPVSCDGTLTVPANGAGIAVAFVGSTPTWAAPFAEILSAGPQGGVQHSVALSRSSANPTFSQSSTTTAVVAIAVGP